VRPNDLQPQKSPKANRNLAKSEELPADAPCDQSTAYVPQCRGRGPPCPARCGATSSTGAMEPAQPGGTTSKRSRSSGLGVFRSMLAYSGLYRTEGQQIIIQVDIAWDESWIGTEQVRRFRIEGDKLHIEAAPQPYANFGGRVMRGILVWQREESASK
jgi:hypothetical protein